MSKEGNRKKSVFGRIKDMISGNGNAVKTVEDDSADQGNSGEVID